MSKGVGEDILKGEYISEGDVEKGELLQGGGDTTGWGGYAEGGKCRRGKYNRGGET